MGVWSFTWPVHGSYVIIAWSATWSVHDSHVISAWSVTCSFYLSQHPLKPRKSQTSFPCQTMTRQATTRSFHSDIGGVPSAVLPSKFPRVRSRSQSPFPCTLQTSRAPWSLSPISSRLREGIRASMFELVSHRGESCQFPPVLGTPISSCSFLEPSQLV